MTTMEKKKVLGRGLDSLLPSSRTSPTAAPAAAPQPQGDQVLELAVDKIDRNPYQTRGKIEETALAELAASIVATGVVQPIVVRPAQNGRYSLIAGERRWQASLQAGKTTIPAIVRQVSNAQAMEMTIVENLQREDLNAMEQARAYERLGREFGMTQEQMAQRTGKDRASVANFLRLLRLPEALQQDVEAGALTFGHAKAVMPLESAELMVRCAERVKAQSLSVRQTEELVRKMLEPVVREAKAAPPVDPNVREAERALERSLGVKVKISDRKGKGKIVLEYGSLEDFDRILEALGAQ